MITKSLIEGDAGIAQAPPADLGDRIVRALMGDLTWCGKGPPA